MILGNPFGNETRLVSMTQGEDELGSAVYALTLASFLHPCIFLLSRFNRQVACFQSSLWHMVCPSEFAVNPYSKISKCITWPQRNSSIQLSRRPLISIQSNFNSRYLCRTESNALEKSRKILWVLVPLLRALAHLWVVANNWAWIECSLWILCWLLNWHLFLRILWF